MTQDKFGSLALFKVGDLVKHRDSGSLIFRIMGIFEGVPPQKGNHLYECVPFTDETKVYKYHESDLSFAETHGEES